MRAVFRVAALVVLAIIALDVADAACDPLRVPADRPGLGAPVARAAEACSGLCVPDCFCCSSTLPAIRAIATGVLGLLPGAPIVPVLPLTQGAPLVRDHVPKSIL